MVHYVPDSVDHILIGELKPNFKYSCIIVGEKWKSDSNSLECLLHFSTLYGGEITRGLHRHTNADIVYF